MQTHLAISDHGCIGYAVITIKKFWDELPADIRTQLDGAMRDATKYANAIAEQETSGKEVLDALEKETAALGIR